MKAFYFLAASIVALIDGFEVPLMELDMEMTVDELKTNLRNLNDGVPVAILHGMGDSCFNGGMIKFAETVSNALGGVVAKCVPTADTQVEDTTGAFSQTMTVQVDEFAKRAKIDPDFAGGFRIIGISQGTLLGRGYIQRYSWRDDYPTADKFMAIHGPLMGVGKLPLCSPTDGTIGSFCNLLNTLTGDAAYRPVFQTSLAQANYYRHPCYTEDYLGTSFLPPLNFETTQSYPEVGEVRGIEDLSELILVKALQDTVVYPLESSWFGIYKDGACGFDEVLTMEEGDYFKDFGLNTLNRRGKIALETTPRGHVQLSDTELTGLVQKYFD